MEAKAYIKNIRISPKKLRFLLADVKTKKPADALFYLLYTPQKGARVFYKAIKSAISNAVTNLKVSEDALVFKTLTVEEGQKLRRFKAGGRGMTAPFKRRFSHIRVVLTADKISDKKVEEKSLPATPMLEEKAKTVKVVKPKEAKK